MSVFPIRCFGAHMLDIVKYLCFRWLVAPEANSSRPNRESGFVHALRESKQAMDVVLRQVAYAVQVVAFLLLY
ncbi:hypothetical protein NC653_012789 [Populus alba x Populus x berolinensis]|uniref:Uncharacterized protein n=1 Tax=Populus alba x Populus x berolinensis TaxID=444605 RepID=A0AAD6QST0_9ROSI|nr:hypothetical protein NC653_012781 [Populus alba x Populus x berolinensis]KAJ6996012.1 hypothetical protein NC653_012789 [Populus alba x Populus x berolinensis]